MEEQDKFIRKLEDIDIIITLRSGSTSLKNLQMLIKVLTTSLTSLEDLKIVTTENEVKVKSFPSGQLINLKSILRIE